MPRKSPPSFSAGRVLVTGGAGFIGSALIWALNQRGVDDILVADFLGNDDKFLNLVPLRFADYLEADHLLAALGGREPRLRGVRWVFHLGACSATTERDARYLLQNNYEYTKALAAWSLKNKSRFVYASSAATYGDGAQGMDDQDPALGRLRPLNPYGYSKHIFDLHAQREGFLDRVVGLKYFNVFGPNEGHKGDMRSVVHKAFHQIQADGRVQLFKSRHPDYPDGGQKRDFLYVKDAVAMTLHLAGTRAPADCSTSAAASRTPGWNSSPRFSPRSAARPKLTSLTCRNTSAPNTSISPRPTSPSCAPLATPRPLPPSSPPSPTTCATT